MLAILIAVGFALIGAGLAGALGAGIGLLVGIAVAAALLEWTAGP